MSALKEALMIHGIGESTISIPKRGLHQSRLLLPRQRQCSPRTLGLRENGETPQIKQQSIPLFSVVKLLEEQKLQPC
jgi:hypothetical protein